MIFREPQFIMAVVGEVHRIQLVLRMVVKEVVEPVVAQVIPTLLIRAQMDLAAAVAVAEIVVVAVTVVQELS